MSKGDYQKYGQKFYQQHREEMLMKQRLYWKNLTEEQKGVLRVRTKIKMRQQQEKKFGVTYPTWWLCDICSKPISLFAKNHDNRIFLDHNHEKKEFRGWLCRGCNIAIGKFEARSIGILGYLKI